MRLLPGGVTHDVRLAEPFPLAVARADGARKWDLDGHELVCYVMGHGALLLGHGHPDVVAPFGSRRPGRCIRTLLVFDEVVSGFRWAPGGVQELTGVLPDLTVLGKVLAGGMPGGAVCGRADLIDLLSGPAAGPRRVAHPEN